MSNKQPDNFAGPSQSPKQSNGQFNQYQNDILSAVAQKAIDAIIVCDNQGKIVLWNRAAESMFGYSASEAIDKLDDIIVPTGKLREAHSKGLKRVFSTGEARAIGSIVESTGLRKDGVEIPIELALSQEQIDGKVFFAAIVRDISARKQMDEEIRRLNAELEQHVVERTAQLQASEAMYLIVADNTYDWEFWLSPDGQFVYTSPSCERITGHTPEEFATDPDLLHRILHPNDRSAWKAHRHEAEQGKTIVFSH